MRGERAPRDAWQALLGGVTREELAALSDADWDLIERRAVAVFAAVDRITAVIAERDAGGAGRCTNAGAAAGPVPGGRRRSALSIGRIRGQVVRTAASVMALGSAARSESRDRSSVGMCHSEETVAE